MSKIEDGVFASSELTAGQLNALVKKVGGPNMVRKILADRVQVTVAEKEPSKTEVCAMLNGNHCSICGCVFPDGPSEVVCVQGHVIGQEYLVN